MFIYGGLMDKGILNDSIFLRIRDERMKKGISQKELGEKVGLSQQAINRIEQGQRRLEVESFIKICEILNIENFGHFSVKLISSYYHQKDEDIETMKEISRMVSCLNNTGKSEAIKRVEELTFIEKYTKQD